jgi:Haem-binding domain
MRIFKIQLPMVLLIDLALLFVGCSSSPQMAAFEPTAQRSTNAVSTDPQVNAILEQSCFECHSSGGSAPWYASVSPTYLAANSARRVLNFSDWQTYDAQKKANALKNIEQTLSGGSMPPGDYTALDHSARLADDQKQVLLKWALQSALPAHGLTPTR